MSAMRRAVLLALCALLVGGAALLAQITSSTIYGEVTDESGGAVACAEVSVTNSDTNLTRKVETNSAGEYRIELLPIGNYTVDLENRFQEDSFRLESDYVCSPHAESSPMASSSIASNNRLWVCPLFS